MVEKVVDAPTVQLVIEVMSCNSVHNRVKDALPVAE
jgi:hypothetical protein